MGLEYEEKSRVRIERLCIRRQLAFAASLPDGAEARDWAERVLDSIPADMSNESIAERSFNGWIEAARSEGFPEWFLKWSVARQDRRDRRRRTAASK
jgi:hypothetical protein